MGVFVFIKMSFFFNSSNVTRLKVRSGDWTCVPLVVTSAQQRRRLPPLLLLELRAASHSELFGVCC